MKPTTKQEKANAKLRSQLKFSHNQVISAFNFGEIKTWEGVYKKLGYGDSYIAQHPEFLKGACTFIQVKEYLTKQREQLERDIVERSTVAQPISQPQPEPQSNENEEDIPRTVNKKDDTQASPRPAVVAQPTSQVVEKEEKQLGIEDDYGLVMSPNESVNYHWFQKKTIAEAIDKLI